MRFSRRSAAIALLALTAVGVGGAISADRFSGKSKFETAVVTRGDIEVAISAAGQVQPKNYVDVGAQVSGQLDRILVKVGDRVERGDLLAEIDETLAATKVAADRAQLDELKASQAQQLASLELARANAERADMLFRADAISKADYQAAIAERKIATARRDQLDAQIARQNSTLQADLATLDFTKIYAPMSGTIVSQSALEGQTLNANQTAPTILRIADLSMMTVEADVSEADVLRVKPGQEAYFTTLGGADERWRTTVRQVLPQPEVLNDVVLYKVLLDIENPNDLLNPEMTAQVFFVSGRAKDVVLAPVAALRSRPEAFGKPNKRDSPQSGLMQAQARESSGRQRNREPMRSEMKAHPVGQRKFVSVLVDGKPQPRPVLVGLATRAEAEIVSGLEPGETVITGEAIKESADRQQTDYRAQRPPGMGRRGPG